MKANEQSRYTGAGCMIKMSKGRAQSGFTGAGNMVMMRTGRSVPALYLREGQ